MGRGTGGQTHVAGNWLVAWLLIRMRFFDVYLDLLNIFRHCLSFSPSSLLPPKIHSPTTSLTRKATQI